MNADSNPPEDNRSVSSYLRHLRALRRAPRTLEANVLALGQFCAYMAAEGVEAPEGVVKRDIDGYLGWMHEHYAAHTVRVRYTVVRAWFKWLFAEDDIDANPTERIAAPAADQVQKDVVTPEDMARVFAALERDKRWRDLAVLAILYDTGLRASELAGLTRDAINLDTGLVTVSRSSTKTAAGQRIVRLSPAAIRHVDRWFRRRRDKEPWALVGHKGKMTRHGVYLCVRSAFEDYGVKGMISPHDIRHTSASHVAGLMSESEMMALYGWHDSDMPRYYAREAMRQAALTAHEKASPMQRMHDKR